MDGLDQFEEYLSHIKDSGTKEAFRYLVAASAGLPDFECRPKPHGYITRNFHYLSNGRSLFSFVVNQQSLLWYFIKPRETHPNLSVAGLAETFSKVKLLKSNEFTVRITSVADAKAIMRIAFPWARSEGKQT